MDAERPSTFLSPDEMRVLTGRAWKRLQIAWLAERGYPFELNAAGEPRVLRAYMEKKLGGAPAGLTQRKRKEPNLTPDLSQRRAA
jgi:hypothetical protein